MMWRRFGIERVKFCVSANGYLPPVFLGVHPRVLPQELGGAQAVGVEAHAGAGAAGARAAVTQMQRNRAVHMAGLDEHRRAQRAALVGQLHQVALLHAEA
jgi:hypothetical protein